MKAARESAGRITGEIPVLLRAHARTMELSLSLLPRSLREPLGLAYLLARASDTIADSGSMEAGDRIARLESIRCALDAESPGTLLAGKLPEALSPAERGLINALPRLFALLGESKDRVELAGLWHEILEGQLFDLRRLTPGSEPLAQAELERYCDLVAGSVGRSWTRLIARHAPVTLMAPLHGLLSPASDYGKGLQLLNILRDRAADRASGRRYIAEEDVPMQLGRARVWLNSGERYLSALRPGRILMASALPLDLAKATITLVASAPAVTRTKLPRSAVRRVLAAGMLYLVLPRRHDPA